MGAFIFFNSLGVDLGAFIFFGGMGFVLTITSFACYLLLILFFAVPFLLLAGLPAVPSLLLAIHCTGTLSS